MKIWEIQYLVFIYKLIKDNKININWELISYNKTIPLIIFCKFIDNINFFSLSRHPEINELFINNYPNHNWDRDYINWINGSTNLDMQSIIDMQSRVDYFSLLDLYFTKYNYNNEFKNLEMINFKKEKLKYKLEFYVKLIQKKWRSILLNPHTKVGNKYLLKQFNKLTLETSFFSHHHIDSRIHHQSSFD